MATLTIDNLPDDLMAQLQQLATQNNHGGEKSLFDGIAIAKRCCEAQIACARF
jgi:plasmid stability protein